ncbi:MAG: 50S ribosomal protein L29 [Candidatus Paceibacterota bacterium]|jgi:ribosomal protein L29
MTKKDNMTTKTDQELLKLLADARADLRAERFSAAGARAKDSNAKGKLRKNIARVLTEQGRRLSGSASRPEASGHARVLKAA